MVALLVPAPAWIERHYSNGFYPLWDRLVRSGTDRVPFSVGDCFFIGIAALFIINGVTGFRAAPRGQRLRTAGRLAFGACVALAIIFMGFMGSWAYNYRRVPLNQKIVLHLERTDTASVTALAQRAVRMLNANVAGAHTALQSDTAMRNALEPTFYATIRRLGDREAFVPPPVKPTIFEPFMRASATSGFTDPWTHEINLSTALFSFERPAMYAHEWAHVAGFADESEANYIAAVTCINSREPALRYAGWILIWFNLPANIHVRQRALPAVIADIHAIVARYRRQTQPGVERMQRTVYGSYLRANNVHAGVASYQLFVQLITAGEFDHSGLPVVKSNL